MSSNIDRSGAVEDYLKAVFVLGERSRGVVGTNALAERLGVTPASASAMVRRLADAGLLDHHPYHGAALTAAGRKLAAEVVRNHRLVELFLVEELGFGWDEVDAEAEALEHVISPRLADRIAAKLDQPSHDPHGDPIPTRRGRVRSEPSVSLAGLPAGGRARVVRVSDSDPALLRYLAERGLVVGTVLESAGQEPFEGPVLVRVAGVEQRVALGAARAVRVEVLP